MKLDEPAVVSVAARGQFLLHDAHAHPVFRHGLTIPSSHDFSVIGNICDNVVLLSSGHRATLESEEFIGWQIDERRTAPRPANQPFPNQAPAEQRIAAHAA
jgi:ABC-type Na+ transport system ATPase subunit NatA